MTRDEVLSLVREHLAEELEVDIAAISEETRFKEDLDADSLEDKYAEVHAAIRANPVSEKKARAKPSEAKRWQAPKLTYEERKERLKQKLATLAAGDDE